MMRLPLFHYRAPRTLAEVAQILAGEGREAMLLAGGTDLLPNMKRRQQAPRTVVALRQVAGLRELRNLDGSGVSLGPCLTLSDIVRNALIRESYTALWQAADQVATPHIRNMGTLGGNLCLDTRCHYYDQNYEWRKAINFCLKKDGQVCWVAPGSARCLAVSSTDTGPALMALGARLRLVSESGERQIALSDFYSNDGIAYLARKPDEIVAEVLLPESGSWRSTYWKLRRRGSFDFPVLSVAAAARLDGSGVIEQVRLVLGAVSSRPLEAAKAEAFLIGKKLSDDVLEEASSIAAMTAKPMDNTDFDLTWRKKVTREFVALALREVRGDSVQKERRRYMHR